MSLWILAILIIAIFAAIGFFQGAIRSAISLVGLILALLFAVPFGNVLKPLLVPLGINNPVWQALIPPVVAFLLIYLVIAGLSFFAHHKVYLMYKYKRDDADRIRWERVNSHAGAALGVLTGVIMFLAVSGLIYAGGYLTIQLSGDQNPGYVKFINSVRQAMADTGFDKAAAKFEPANENFYQTADILGLLYHNPLLQSRLVTYPYFLSLSDRTEFQEIGSDKEYNDLIFGKAPVTQIIEHPKTQTILGNAEIMEYLKGADRQDLNEYLRTGKSPKYEEEEILGVWNLDKDAVLTYIRKSKPDIKAIELRTMKMFLDSIPSVSLIARPDNKVFIRTATPTPPPAEEQPAEAPVTDPAMDRYRQFQPQQPVTPAPAPAQPETSNQMIVSLSGEGTWEEQAGQYVLKMQSSSGNTVRASANIRADEMMVTGPDGTLVFIKQ